MVLVAHLARGRLLRPALRSPALHAHAIRTRRCLLSTTGSTAEAEAGWASDLSWVVDMLQFGAFVALVNHYVISMTQCIGPSMKPTLTSAGDIVLLWPVPMARLLHGGPQLGDVVIATSVAPKIVIADADENEVHEPRSALSKIAEMMKMREPKMMMHAEEHA